MRKWIWVFVIAIIAVLLLRTFVFTPYKIPSSGMESALYEGDRIIVNKWSYGLRLPLMSLFSYHRWDAKTAGHGDLVVFNNPLSTEKVIDQREVFIGRCVGIPGDSIMIDTLFNTISGWARTGPDRRNLYAYPETFEPRIKQLMDELSIENNYLMGSQQDEHIRSFTRYEYYLIEQAAGEENPIRLLDLEGNDDIRELVVPAAGKTITFDPWNLTLYRNIILLHEGKYAEIVNDSLFIDGKQADSYTFTKDYYWMMSNNTINMADSRLFGFVPQENLIGRAAFIWFSKEPCTGIFKGYRWNRIFDKI